MHRIRLVIPALLALILPLVGCSEDRPDRAITIEESEGADDRGQGTEGDADEPADEPEAAAGRPLDDEQAQAALLTVQDLPSGWAKSPDEDDEEEEETIEPARCQRVFDTLDELGDEVEADAEAEATFNKGGPFGVHMTQVINSYPQEVDPEWLQRIADGFTECPEFTSIDSDGAKSEVTVSPMSFANLGDETLAVAMTYDSEMFSFSVNIAYIAIGHNLVGFSAGGIAGVDGAELERLARKGISNLERAASD